MNLCNAIFAYKYVIIVNVLNKAYFSSPKYKSACDSTCFYAEFAQLRSADISIWFFYTGYCNALAYTIAI